MMEPTTQEIQMIEIIRESRDDGFRLLIERQEGAWDITVTAIIEGRFRKARGTGTSFAQA